MWKYRNRVTDQLLADKLQSVGGVLIQGPKWCGKTTSAEQFAKSVVYMADPQNIRVAELSTALILRGDVPRLVDEWQVVPQLWDAARFEIDHRHLPGQFIFTGSAVPADMSQVLHSGTGRFSRLTMRTMSLYESGDSSGDVSLEALFGGGQQVVGQSEVDINQLAFLICRGGWPSSIDMEDSHALQPASDYLDAVVNLDISRVDNIRRNPARAMAIMRSLARNQGAQTPATTIRQDIAANYADTFSVDSIVSYVDALKSIFVVEDSPAWNPNIRSKTAIRTSDTRYFSDPSIAAAALGVGPADLISDLNTMGLLFETMCVRDLRVYASVLDGQIYHYRDKNGLECDMVVHLRNGRYGLIEVKLGGDKAIEAGAATLQSLASKIDTDKMPAPSFLMVLTGVGRYAYRRADGVYVVPISCLKP